jgi:hypothetical protein
VTPATNATFEAVFGPNERVHLFRRSVTDWVRTVDLVTSAVTSSATQFPSPNGAAARAGTTEVYSYNDTTITQWNGSAAPLAPVRSTAFGQLGNVYFSPAGTFAISSFADLIDLDALVSNIDILNDFIVHAAAHAPALHELAFVGTPRSSPGPYFLVVMTDQLGPPFYIGLPEAVPQPQAVSVAINDAGSQVYIVLRGAAGNTVLLTVPL